YDTADDFVNGNHCCGYDCCNATAALMAIQYYRKLPAKPITCTRGGTHTSDYGSYISRVYSYNGHTYNVPSAYAPPFTQDVGFYGGFGYYLQDANGTPSQRYTRLSEYISYHGLTSSIDYGVSGESGFTKICAQIDAGYPVVVLTGILGGHYIICIGYVKAQHTLIFNDPYGDYATYGSTSQPNKNGARVFYDWYGYSYGHPNLGQIDLIIYARGGTADTTPPTVAITSPTSGSTYSTTS